jgi:hypothetical protein
LADRARQGSKPGRQERNEMLHVLRNVRRVAPPLREGIDPVQAGGGVVDRAEHEMKSPEHFVARELGVVSPNPLVTITVGKMPTKQTRQIIAVLRVRSTPFHKPCAYDQPSSDILSIRYQK